VKAKVDVEDYYDRLATEAEEGVRQNNPRSLCEMSTESFLRCGETSVAILQTLYQLPRRMAYCAIQPRNSWNVGASTTRNC